MLKKISLAFMILCTVSCTGFSVDAVRKKPKLQYAIYISGVPKNDIVDYLDAMEKKEYYVSHKLLRIADDYAEIIYWAMETPEAIHLETDLFFADRTVTLTKRTILVRQQEE